MPTYLDHQALVYEYQKSAQTVRRFRMYPFAFQIGILSILICLKFLQIDHLNLIAVIFFALFLLIRIRDFNLRRMLDQKMTQITLEGINQEKQNPRLERFFYEILDNFGIIRAMLLRALHDVMGVFFLGCAVFQLILERNPDFAINFQILYPIVGILGFFLADLYYKPLKALVKAKQEVFC